MSTTTASSSGQVAVIGIACRFPKADSPAEFWRNLAGARDCITRFGEDSRQEPAGIDDRLTSAQRVLANGVLNDIELFDAALFGFSANEATITDPQQRLALEVAWQCLVDAGIDPRAAGSCVGVFTSSSSSTYLINELLPQREKSLSAGGVPLLIRNDKDHTASLIAYKLGCTGPALNVGCGCSGGLAAVHVGISNLLTWQSDVALCGASSVLVPQQQGHLAVANGIYSHDGYCRVFDESATGTVGGAGVGFVLLKRLEDAVRDGDRIHATILGSAMNNDGHAKAGYTAPSVNQQAAVIAMAQSASAVDADTISLIEAHGTGTALGDPIEVQALTRAFSRSTRNRNYCALGSVKSNIGHADVAAGMAGLIKTVLALEHATIPPTLHFSKPNPQLQLDESPFYVNAAPRPWEPRHGVRRAGVTSLGMGGTNVHIVLEEFKPAAPLPVWSADRYVFPLSAHSAQALESWQRSLAGYLADNPRLDVGSLAYTLATRRPAMKVRRAIVAADLATLRAELTKPASDSASSGGQLNALAHAWESGDDVDWKSLYTNAIYRWLELPAYPLLRERYWIERDEPWARAQARYAEYMRPEHFVALPADLHAGLDALCRIAIARTHSAVHPRHERFFASLQARAGELPEPQGELRSRAESLKACFPAFAALVDIVVAACESLPDHLSDATAGALAFHRLLDGGGLQRALETKPPFTNVAACAIAAAGLLAERVKRSERPLRILEVGAGRMILTQFMEELIRDGRVEYWITDVSPTLVRAAVKVVEARGLKARTAVIDVTRKIADQCPDAGSFDAILALNVVHVCPDVDVALANLRAALASRGELMLLEATRDPLWSTLIWGWSEGWWNFEDGRRTVSPLLGSAAWRGALESLQPTSLVALESDAAGGDTGLWVASFAAPPTVAAPESAVESLRTHESGPDQWLYKPCFIRQSPPKASGSTAAGTWIVFEDNHAEPLNVAIPGPDTLVIRVTPGPACESLSASAYRVRPASVTDLGGLLKAVVPRLLGPLRMVFAWRLGDGASARFHSLLALAQAAGQELTNQYTIAVVTRGLYDVTGAEPLDASEALVAAVAKVVPREQWSCVCRVVDIEGGAGDGTWERVGELAAASDGPPLVALRAGQYWIPWYSPVSAQHTPAVTQRLRREGTYVIFGGLGGLGFSIARFLAQRYAARLVLASRSADASDPQVAAKIDEIQRLGGTCVVFAADVAVTEDVSAALREAEESFGTVSGVIHSAGEIDDGGVIQNRSLEQMAGKLGAKVAGAQALVEAIGSRQLDFLVLFSSIGSVLYKLKFGEVAYVAGNDFLVCFAHFLARRAPYFVQVIQWTDWESAGMWARARAALQDVYTAEPGKQEQLTRDLLHALTQEQGTSTFEHALKTDETHVLVSLQPLEALLRDHERYQPADYGEYLNRLGLARRAPEQPAPVAEPVDASEKDIRVLRSIWEEVIGCRVEPESDFFELGGDSLLALRVISRVAEEYKVSLPLNAFFSSSTLRDMYMFVDNLRWAGTEQV